MPARPDRRARGDAVEDSEAIIAEISGVRRLGRPFNVSVSIGLVHITGALTTLGQPSLAPFWTDIDIAKGGDIYWDLDASTGKVTVTWLNVAPYSGSGTLSFQLVLTNLGGGDFGPDAVESKQQEQQSDGARSERRGCGVHGADPAKMVA